MTAEQRLHLACVSRRLALFGKRCVDVVVDHHHQAGLRGEIQDAVERRVPQAGDFTGDFGRHKFLVDAELADAGEDSGNVCSTRLM